MRAENWRHAGSTINKDSRVSETNAWQSPLKIGSLTGVLTIAVALGIIFIGVRELFYPSLAAAGFGVPLHDLRDSDLLAIKACRDVVSGLVAVTLLVLGNRKYLACGLGVLSLIPIFDGLIVIRHAGWIFAPVVLVHWGTAVIMLVIAALVRKGK